MEEHRDPAVGDLRGHRNIGRTQRRNIDRDVGTLRMVDQLERLAQTRALVWRERQLVAGAVVLHHLAAPNLAADLDQLTLAADRAVVGHAVPALDHLRARRTDAQNETSSETASRPAAVMAVSVGVRE